MKHMPYALRLTPPLEQLEDLMLMQSIKTLDQTKTTYPCFHMSNPIVNIILINLKLGSCIKGVEI